MIQIIDFDSCPVNERNGTYGGMAGDKEGITFQGEYWIIKYPKSTKGMRGDLISYMTSPLSEFIGSNIYDILGYDVHETLLGIRNDKLIVACKDFCVNEGALREVRTLKNVYNTELSKRVEKSISSTSSSHIVDLQEMMLHFKYNPILSKIPDLKERFWNCVVVDILINNNDRNNGNWGILYENKEYKLAPVFDNGAAFSNKYTDEKIADILSNPERMRQSIMAASTVYGIENRMLSAQEILRVDNSDLRNALKCNLEKIRKKMPEIKSFIYEIPEYFGEYPVCSNTRKEFYVKGMELRVEQLLEPALEMRNNYEKQTLRTMERCQ